MLEALDGESGASTAPLQDAEAAMPHVVARRGRGRRGGGKGRARGSVWDDHQRTRIALGNARDRLRQHADLLHRQSFAESVSQEVFGCPPDHFDVSATHCTERVRMSTNDFIHVQVDRRRRRGRDVNRGAVSHVTEQAAGIAAFLESPGGGPAAPARADRATYWINIFDDADMWMQPPPGWIPRQLRAQGVQCAADLPPAVTKTLSRRGKNVHVPVFNVQETVLTCDLHTRTWRAADVVSPSVPLPCANYGTVCSRWSRWSCLGFDGRAAAGSHIDPDGVLKRGIEQQNSEQILFVMRDGIGVNSCVTATIAAASRRSRGQPGAFYLWELVCLSHCNMLSTRPTLEGLDGVVPMLTRIGHLFAGGRWITRFNESLKAVAEETAFVDCAALPIAANGWRAEAAAILQATRPALDMTPDAEEFVLAIMNDRWVKSDPQPTWRHFHTPGCRCGGPQNFKDSIWACFQLLCGHGAPQCLMYRWKGFEQAVCYAKRGMKAYAMLPRALTRMYRGTDFNRACAELAAAAANHEEAPAAANTVRAGKVLGFFQDPKAEEKLDLGVLLCAPAQGYLNTTFNAEQKARRAVDIMTAVPRDPVGNEGNTPALREALDDAMSANLKLLRGIAGKRVQREFAKLLFDFEPGLSWGDVKPERKTQFEAAKNVCKSLASRLHVQHYI